MSLSKILVVIDPTLEIHPAIERALESATLTGARLHLYLCTADEGHLRLEVIAHLPLSGLTGKEFSRLEEPSHTGCHQHGFH
jgi:hypothetical protein